MPHADFIHLRVHSAYSLSEGAVHVKDLVKNAAAMDMPAVAVTDTNNLFGALEFSGAAKKAGVQPIVGCQLRVEDGAAGATSNRPNAEAVVSGNMVFLVKDDAGYRNLLKLISHAYLKTVDAHDPHVLLDVLAENGAGLIALTGGADGPLGRLLAAGQTPAAEAFLDKLQAIFGDRLYIEIQRHGLPQEQATERPFLDLAYARDIPLVATNEVFFAERDMSEAHDALLCIAGGAYVSQSDRRRMTPDHYLKTADEMRRLFADLPEAVDNTRVVAKRCAYMVEEIAPILPPYDCGEGQNEQDELRAQAAAGLEERLETQVYPEHEGADRDAIAKPYRERLEYELGVI
ncbi:MAG: PHP domain-containing protein, partial [Rhodospirillaceae bacterium]